MALQEIWAMIIGVAIFLYVVLDGFDLGIGILFLRHPEPKDRAVMLSTIVPIWDGNQTWLVFGGATLYGAFPGVFSAILPSIYIPMILMLVFLLLRGVSLEFRLKSKTLVPMWERVFCISSLLTTLCQGAILGTYVVGFGTVTPSYTNVNTLSWLTPFSLLSALGLVAGYAHLGSCWLIIKTQDEVQAKAYQDAQYTMAISACILIIFCLWTPFLSFIHYNRWLSQEALPILMLLPLCCAAFMTLSFYALGKKYQHMPFACGIGLFICAASGVVNSIYPYIVPHSITLQQAGASEASLQFMLYGALIMLPLLFAYTAYSHYVFRGKVSKIIAY